MDLHDIKLRAEDFFDWPSDRRDTVTYQSAMLFAWHCVREYAEKGQISAVAPEQAKAQPETCATDNSRLKRR